MKVVIINVCAGCYSTGRICSQIAQSYIDSGNQCMIVYGQNSKEERLPTISFNNKFDIYKHVLKTRLFDNTGFESKKSTKNLLSYLDKFKPDLIWLHNIHGYYINVEMLFGWIKEHPEVEIKWTLHDCWAFTGHCSYFTAVGCDKWKYGCEKCIQKNAYPQSYIMDHSKENYYRKKKAFTGVNNMTIITPSQWLADLVKQSFLKEYKVEVHYNTVDKQVFKKRVSDFRTKFKLEKFKIVLGVACPWSQRKGLNDFIQLSKKLPSNYKIVLVGLNKKQIKSLPNNIIGLNKTDSAIELAEIYSTADVFVNPTYEDNYPTTNLEAKACGTPVITYNTGGSPESVLPQNVVEVGNIDGLIKRIYSVCENM